MTTRKLAKNFLSIMFFCAIFITADHVKAQDKYFCCVQDNNYSNPFPGETLPNRANCYGCPTGNELGECQSISDCACVFPQETSLFNQNCIANSDMAKVPSKEKK